MDSTPQNSNAQRTLCRRAALHGQKHQPGRQANQHHAQQQARNKERQTIQRRMYNQGNFHKHKRDFQTGGGDNQMRSRPLISEQ